MKKIECNNPKKGFLTASILIYVYACLGLLILGIGIYMIISNGVNNLVEVEGVIKEIRLDTENSWFFIELENTEYHYYLYSRLLDGFENNLRIGDSVKYIISPNTFTDNKKLIFVIIKDGVELVNHYDDYMYNNAYLMVTLGAIILIVLGSLGTILLILHFKKDKKTIEVEYVNYYITNNVINPNFIIRKDGKTQKQVSQIVIGYLIVILILIIVIIIGCLKMPDNPLAIILTSLGVAVIASIHMIKEIAIPKYKEKDIDEYMSLYYDNLMNYKNIAYPKNPYIEFNDEGINFIDYVLNNETNKYDKVEIFVTYKELDFHALGVYRNSFNSCLIVVASNLDDNNERFKDTLDVVWFLNVELLHLFKFHKVNVKGLDYLLENFKEEIIKNDCKKIKTLKIVDYKDY